MSVFIRGPVRHDVSFHYVPTCSGMTIKFNLNFMWEYCIDVCDKHCKKLKKMLQHTPKHLFNLFLKFSALYKHFIMV